MNIMPTSKTLPAIPSVMHQIFISNDKIPKLPKQWKTYTKKAIALHPKWHYMYWDKNALYDFIGEHYQAFVPYFTDTVPVVIQADIGRYLILKHFGGWYFDYDYELVQSLDVWNTHSILLPCEREPNETENTAIQIGNAILASIPQHWFWDMLLETLPPAEQFPLNISHQEVIETTGPNKITNLYLGLDEAQQASITCPQSICFHTPTVHHLSSHEYKMLLLNPDLYGIHHTHCSWRDDDMLKNIKRRKYLFHPLTRPLIQKWGEYLEKKRRKSRD